MLVMVTEVKILTQFFVNTAYVPHKSSREYIKNTSPVKAQHTMTVI